MPAPLAKGIIIAASVLVAAGIAIYESPQVRQWVDQSRRKIAVALHSLGDDVQPRRPSEASADYESRKRREELIRCNRNELIRRAREEGVAVDLDELAEIGKDDVEMAEVRNMSFAHTRQGSGSFDDLVGSDGMLRKDLGTTTGVESTDNNVRRRGMAGFAAGTAVGTNPFSDDNMLFDHTDKEDEEEAPSPKQFEYVEPRERSTTIEHLAPVALPTTNQLVDLTPELQPENPQTASIPPSDVVEIDQDPTSQSFYSFSSNSTPNSIYLPPTFIPPPAPIDDDDDIENVSAGTLTPRSEHSAFTSVSVVGSHADDIANFSSQNGDDMDARSEVFSEGGFTDGDFSEGGFSDVASVAGRGVMTPSSWTDVGSDDESEWGETTQGQVSQMQQLGQS